MGQILHDCSRTTAAVRRAIQHSQESLIALAARYDINPKTVHKWRRRSFVKDARMGPRPHSSILSAEQEAVAVAFRKRTLLPLDDCFYALQASIPRLTRSSLHRCFLRHGISRLPELDGCRPVKKKRFKAYPIGYFHVDLTEVRTQEGKLYLFVAVDRTSKFTFARLVERATRESAADFLRALIKAVPYKIHTVLTDNGTHFTTPGNIRSAAADIKLALQRGEIFRAHAFELACARSDIDHRLTKPAHPWTNGQVERMNRTIKEATIRTYHYDGHDQLRQHLTAFLNAYNFAKRLKTLAGLTSYQFICSCWQKESNRFNCNPHHLSRGLNI